jgi:predicted TIM-barrel fold metal-dependent hydrolase
VPLLPAAHFASATSRQEVARRCAVHNLPCTLGQYVEAMHNDLQEAKRQGVVGVKMVSTTLAHPTAEGAQLEFDHLLAGREHEAELLEAYLLHELLEMAAEEGMVVAVHCGLIWSNWGDFTKTNPQHMVPTLLAHRRTKFDLYHAGIPWVREIGVIGKTFPNVWLNLCWTHIISPAMTMSALNEWLELLPYTKILGFGGDYGRPVEKVYGHLQLALEDIAQVLAGRVEQGWMTEAQAVTVAHAWLWDNPVELYGLQERVQ